MSKTKTLFTVVLLVLLGSMGAAQAQNFSEIKLFATPKDYAREGGKNEAAGSILLNSSDAGALQAAGAMIMLHFSVPLAADVDATTQGVTATEVTVTGDTGAVVTGKAANQDNDGNGTIMIDPGASAGQNLLIQGVKLDVSGADEPVTVTLKVTAALNDFIRIDGPSSAMVIGGIKVGVEASAEEETVRTRGTGAGVVMASLTLRESFKDAFMTDNMVTVKFSGIPEGVTLTAMVTNNLVADAAAVPPVVIDNTTPYASVGIVEDGSATVTLGGDADMQTGRPAPTEVTLGLTLTADPDNENISFPLSQGSVMAKATFTDPTGVVNDFEDAFTDYVIVFNIRPAQCELLFPVVTVLDPWNTAISVINPAYGEEMEAGGLEFTFYGVGGVVAMYDTTVDMVTGVGLEADGTLSPGGTYQVMADEILAATAWGETFRGHVRLTADYINCSGLGWVTDFMGANQAYTATVINKDTGAMTN